MKAINIITALVLVLIFGCSKPPTQIYGNTEIQNLGYVRHNSYVQDLGCIPITSTAYNSFDTTTKTLVIHNDSVHIEVTDSYDLHYNGNQAWGKFTTSKGDGMFLYVPIVKS